MPKKILIEDATPEQQRKFLKDYLAIAQPPNTKPETTLAAIKEGWKPPHIFVDDGSDDLPEMAAPVAEAAIAGRPVPSEPDAVVEPEPVVAMKEPLVRIMLGEQDGAGGKRAVPVGVNGVAILVPRNVECELKLRYFDALKSAMQTFYEQDEESGDLNDRSVYSYPFSVIRMPSQAEVEAWHASVAEAERLTREAAALAAAKRAKAA